MLVRHVGIPNSVYWDHLAAVEMDESHVRAIKRVLNEHGLTRVLVFGSNSRTGLLARHILDDRFVGYVNRETLDPGLRIDFDAVVLAVSPRRYKKTAAELASIFPDRDFLVITLFDDDPETRYDSKGRRLPVEPCHLDKVLIRFNGEVFPCCQVFMDRDKAIGNIRDMDVAEQIRGFDMDCSCAGKGFRPLRETESLDIDSVICELSMVCNGKCAMCCAHSPEYTKEFGSARAPVVQYEAIERALEALRPRTAFFQGGEVLIDPASLAWLEGLRDRLPSLHMTLVTNGNVPGNLADRVFDVFDYCIVDFYGFQPFTYQTITGLPMERTLAFAERLLEMDRKRVTLKYLSTPINFHESVLFLEWALERRPDEIAVIDADSDWYIRHDPLVKVPKFDPYAGTDLLPDIYWSRLISRTTDRLRRLLRKHEAYCREHSIRLLFWGGLFYTYPVWPLPGS